MSDLEEFAGEAQLRAALDRALRKIDSLQRTQSHLSDAVYQAAHDGISAMKIPGVPKPKIAKSKGDPEAAIAVLSDWQLGKLTASYSTQACRERIAAYGEKVIDLTKIQRKDHPVTEIHVDLLGDLLEGELIFPGQAHRIDASLFRQVMTDGPEILAGLIRRFESEFDKVYVKGVIGNHGKIGGRSSREMNPESNSDSMLYEVAKLLTESERVIWTPNVVDNERNWFAIDEVMGNRFFLFHGDQVKGGFAGFPWYGFGRRLLGWAQLYDFQHALSGHFHTPVNAYYPGGIRHWGNGSTESDNTYAAENMSASGEPCQWLLFVHPSGVSAEYLVRL